MKKWQRNYRLTIQKDGEDPIVVEYPMTLELSIIRANYAKSGQAMFRIYNLSQITRGKVYQNYNEQFVFRSVKLEAGYGDNLGTIFDGNVVWARSSRREGQTNFITEINGFDFGFVKNTSESNWSVFDADASKDRVIRRLCGDLKRPVNGVPTSLPIGAIGSFSETPRPRYHANGNTWDALMTETEDKCYIDNGKIYCLNDNEVVEGFVTEIGDRTGLLGTPVVDGVFIIAEMLFEPGLIVGQSVNLLSSALNTPSRNYNGEHKVIGIEHRGIISGAMSGKLITKVTMMIGSEGGTGQFATVN